MADEKKKKGKTRAEKYHNYKERSKTKSGFAQRPMIWKKNRVLAGDKMTVNGMQYDNMVVEKLIGENAPSDAKCKTMNAPHVKAAAQKAAKEAKEAE